MKKIIIAVSCLISMTTLMNAQGIVDPYHNPEMVVPVGAIDFGYLQTDNEYTKPVNNLGYKVEEVFLKGKKSPQSNEDGIILTSDFIAVIDGATSKSAFAMDGKSSGRLSMEEKQKKICKFSN